MPDQDKRRLQIEIVEKMRSAGKASFRGPVALELALRTADKNPSPVQTIAKNVLDLLAQPLAATGSRRHGLLYYDDKQVHALSVSCLHGREAPEITITAQRHRDFLDDLSLATQAEDDEEEDRIPDSHDAVTELNDLKRDEAPFRTRFGDHAFEAWLSIAQWRVQQAFLARAMLSPTLLARLHGVVPHIYGNARISPEISGMIETLLRSSPLHIFVGELPQVAGTTNEFKAEIARKIGEFKSNMRWLTPLLVPIAVEVFVKPPPLVRAYNEHDLDNVLREYLLPSVLDQLEPPSDIDWAHERIRVGRGQVPHVIDSLNRAAVALPKATRIGVTRYDAWRLPRHADDSSPGFVGLTVVQDDFGGETTMRRIDAAIERWERSQD